MAINQYGNQYYQQQGQNQNGPSSPVGPYSGQNQISPLNQVFSNTITNSIVWVETEDEAKTWMVGPNNRVFIFVGDNEVLYVKEKNSDGRPLKTEIYDLSKRQMVEEGLGIELKEYVRKEDVQKMIDEAVAKATENQRNKNGRNFQNHSKNYKNNRDGGYEE